MTRVGANGYVSVGLFGKDWLVHRMAWLFETGLEPLEIDHIDRNRANNKFSNLRDVSHSVNVQNAKDARVTNQSGMLGVSYRADIEKWQAGITTGGVRKYLGVYDSPEKARDVYLAAKREMHEGYVE